MTGLDILHIWKDDTGNGHFLANSLLSTSHPPPACEQIRKDLPRFAYSQRRGGIVRWIGVISAKQISPKTSCRVWDLSPTKVLAFPLISTTKPRLSAAFCHSFSINVSFNARSTNGSTNHIYYLTRLAAFSKTIRSSPYIWFILFPTYITVPEGSEEGEEERSVDAIEFAREQGEDARDGAGDESCAVEDVPSPQGDEGNSPRGSCVSHPVSTYHLVPIRYHTALPLTRFNVFRARLPSGKSIAGAGRFPPVGAAEDRNDVEVPLEAAANDGPVGPLAGWLLRELGFGIGGRKNAVETRG